MSKIAIKPHDSGTGVLTIEAPNTDTDRTFNLPDASGVMQVQGQPVVLPDGSQLSSTPLTFKNKVINGSFDIWQRGASQTTSGYGSDDRWTNNHSVSTKTHSQQEFTLGQTDVPGNPRYYSRTVVVTGGTSSSYTQKFQSIESVSTLAGKTATLSFYAKADSIKNIVSRVYQSFGTGGTPSAVVFVSTVTHNLTTSWQKFSVTIDVPSVNGKTLGTNNNDALAVGFWFDVGSDYAAQSNSLGNQSGTFDIAQVQLEEGSVASPFEQRPIGLELSLCQRYYETGTLQFAGMVTTGISYRSETTFRVTKRVTPSITFTNSVSSYFGTTVGDVSCNSEWLQETRSCTGTSALGIFRSLYTASAEI